MSRPTVIACDAPGCNKMTRIYGPDYNKWALNTKRTITGSWTGDQIEVEADFCPKHKEKK